MPQKPELVKGSLVKLGRGFGFVAPLDGSEDIFIHGHGLCGALPGDTVQVELARYPRRENTREGEVVKIAEYASGLLTGVVHLDNGRWVLETENAPDVLLTVKRSTVGSAYEGDLVAAKLIQRGDRYEDIRVSLTENYGNKDCAAHCAKSIIKAAGITKEFAEVVVDSAYSAACITISGEEIAKRVDLRNECIFTIDSAGTKDIDDAISAYKTDYGYRLCVHIADVSHYVRENTELDCEAMQRGTSVYYADEVVPMLPKAISNGVCSLNEGQDRLAFTCSIVLDNDCVMKDYEFCKTVIRSRVKGVYSEINEVLSGEYDDRLKEKYAEVIETLAVMKRIYLKLAALHIQRGGVDIESDEAGLTIDDDGRCVGVNRIVRGDSERMIEEFMLLANSAAAHFARTKNIPCVYRAHEKPSAEKAQQLKNVLDALGIRYNFAKEIPTQKELARLLCETRGTKYEVAIHTAVLHSMAKAVYSAKPLGHFGLALCDYAHFTSPIRRYPDLAVHRILSDAVLGDNAAKLKKRYEAFAEKAAELSSEKEQNAVKVQRRCDDCYKAEYMKKHIGEEFSGIINSVTVFGIFVSLENTVEGLVHVSTLSHREMYLVNGVCLTEGEKGRSFTVGDELRVRVESADIYTGRVNFLVVGR